MLAKIDRPSVDIRKPYTEIGGKDAYSGRTYDEGFVEAFVGEHNLPCNTTTAFLTPAFRNIDRLLTTDLVLVGKPREVYVYTLELLGVVHQNKLVAETLLTEILRFLLLIRHENEGRMQQLIANLKSAEDSLPLSSEQIVTLLQQHLNCKNSSRLPALIVDAAYLAVQNLVGETPRRLQSHTAADKQTGSLGDVEITLTNDDSVITCYEMKDKRVTINDINAAIRKVAALGAKIDNYIFITTEAVGVEVAEYASYLYDQTGIEVVVLECVGFARHFLHFFHRYRLPFLDAYQDLVLKEPASSVSQPLKEAFLILRKQAESN
ncbi:MAG: restriction endonuclease, SacI family [Saprospiraceae bacterium]